jgi:type IV pilus assembly protein PilN
MIRINLLPREERRRRAPTSPLVYLVVLAVAVFVLAVGASWYWLHSEIAAFEGQIRHAQDELKHYEEIAKKVEQYKTEKKTLEDKLNIIETLVAAQSGPVRILDEVSRALPGEVWLTSMNRTGKRLDVSGVAFSNFSLATFMTNLGKASAYIRNVDLVVSEKTTVEQVPVERFSITMEVKGGKG